MADRSDSTRRSQEIGQKEATALEEEAVDTEEETEAEDSEEETEIQETLKLICLKKTGISNPEPWEPSLEQRNCCDREYFIYLHSLLLSQLNFLNEIYVKFRPIIHQSFSQL